MRGDDRLDEALGEDGDDDQHDQRWVPGQKCEHDSDTEDGADHPVDDTAADDTQLLACRTAQAVSPIQKAWAMPCQANAEPGAADTGGGGNNDRMLAGGGS